ncbi:MAG: M48 family metalloprotease [Vulcanimicrobiaceae bacterium]
MKLRKILSAILTLALLATEAPKPARAVSTPAEIQQAKTIDKQIVEQYNVVTDPLLNAWVNEVGRKLWTEVARTDVPYNLKILDDGEINSFTIGGGYIYVHTGLLDFVQSDDELAGVIGHETGHNERRHTVTFGAKAQAANILFGLASIFSPFFYNFGQILEAGALAKIERAQELQADQYGLLLMTRAGYDPNAMTSFMRHLGALHNEHNNIVDKYFADHPGVPDRVNHLVGYPELDPTKRTGAQTMVEALHDENEARYNVAAITFRKILKSEPNNATAQLNLAQAEIAVGQPQKSEQTFAAAAGNGDAATRTAALDGVKHLRESEERFNLLQPNLAPLRESLAQANAQATIANSEITTRRDAGKSQIKAVDDRLQDVAYGIPNFSRVNPRPGSRLEAVLKNLSAMGRSIDTALNKSGEVIGGVGEIKKGAPTGLLKENADILRDLEAPLAANPIPPQSLATLSSYPSVIAELGATNGELVRALDTSRSSLALLDIGLGDLDVFIKQLDHMRLSFGDDFSPMDYNTLNPLMENASASLAKAAVAGAQAEQLFNLARSRQLESHIALLGLEYPQARYATLTRALEVRFKSAPLDFTAMERDGLTPGEVAAASIVAADTNTIPQAVVAEALQSHRTIVDVANARGMNALSLEIFLGLIYLDYVDDPQKEAVGLN